MAIKVKRKKTTREEAKEPDQIYTFNERVFNYLEQNKKIVLGSLVAILVAIVIITFITRKVTEAGEEAGSQVIEVVQLLEVPLGQASEDPSVISFETTIERSQAIRDALGDVSDPQAATQLLDGLSSMTLGDIPRAQAAFEAASQIENAPLISLLALQGLAATKAEAGDMAGGEAALMQFSEISPALEDFATMEMGRLNEAAGRLEQAHEHYDALASAETLSAGPDVLVGGIRIVTETARHRAQVLAVVLGASEVDEIPTPEEPNE